MATGLKLSNVLCASDIMTTKLVKLRPEQDVFHAIDLLVKNKISGAPVVDENDMLVGVFTEKCCLEVLVDTAYESLPSNEVGAFMIQSPLTIQENMQLFSIAQMFISQPVRRLPVVRDGKLLGQISRRDAMRHMSEMNKPVRVKGSATLYLSALDLRKSTPV